ncbi:hypothetical protein NDU88_005465 [Pleurodeles waltl]|uniref:Secreted protein n=1 Tax=Pleurodeles waltl TaxID=8319 RepID=A0AAV7L1C1_PLEWA|nr:hypothetical protein NDU88_005465 [Pleurodeles waltl]
MRRPLFSSPILTAISCPTHGWAGEVDPGEGPVRRKTRLLSANRCGGRGRDASSTVWTVASRRAPATLRMARTTKCQARTGVCMNASEHTQGGPSARRALVYV